MIFNDPELIIRGLAAYFGMTGSEFAKLIDGNSDKLIRFYNDFKYNHN